VTGGEKNVGKPFADADGQVRRIGKHDILCLHKAGDSGTLHAPGTLSELAREDPR
jgi:hypothetical protein